MTPSKYQEKIYDWATNGSGSARVMAVAGSGKTSTLIDLAKKVKGDVLFCAFNKHIQKELDKKLPKGVSCRTIHSLGLQALRFALGYAEINTKKYEKICEFLVANMAKQYRRRNKIKRRCVKKRGETDLITGPYRLRRALENVTTTCMTTLMDPNDYKSLLDMCRKYGIEIPRVQREQLFELVPQVIERGIKKTELGDIDYIDMIYYPASQGLKMKRHDWVLVDEAQDLSAAQLAIVMGSLGPSGRLVAVGDKMQSLYGFSGADPWSFKRVQEATVATDLPLSICYRCSKEIVRLAQKLVPEMEFADDATEGSVKTIQRINLVSNSKPGDMVVCRTNAPLIGACIELIKAGKQAFVRGYDLKNTLTTIVDNATADPMFEWEEFDGVICDQEQTIVQSHLEEDDAQGAQMASDRYEAVRVCLRESNASNAEDLKTTIADLFTERKNSIVLSTVHRSKGLEADNVFIIHPHNLRLYWKGQKEWQAYQEQCCEYVAITRAKKNLFFVEEPEKEYKIGDRLNLPREKG